LPERRLDLRKKAAFLLFLVILTCFFLASCGQKKEEVAKDGGPISYTLDEIYSNKTFGFYVRNTDGTFTPVNSLAEGFNGTVTSYDPSRFVWWCDVNTKNKKVDYNRITPRVTKKTPLVAVYSSSNDMPDQYILERYAPLGYTIGTHFSLSEDGKGIYMQTNSPCSTSDMASILSGKGYDQQLEVAEINGRKKLPYSNVDTDINVLLGLQKGKYYKITVYSGTSTRVATTKADTRVFKSREVTVLDSPLKKTQNQYFIVNLPDNLKHGYYYINDAGMFRY